MALGSILGKSTTTWSNSEILSSETAGLFGLGSDATPEQIFNVLADATLYKPTEVVTGINPDSWNLSNSFGNAFVNIAASDSCIIAAVVTSGNYTNCTVYRTTNGTSWEQVTTLTTTGTFNSRPPAIACCNNTFVIADYNAENCWYSQNNGVTWESGQNYSGYDSEKGFLVATDTGFIRAIPQYINNNFCSYIYYSQDGATWQLQTSSGPEIRNCTSLDYCNNNLIVSRGDSLYSYGYYYSSNNGVTWSGNISSSGRNGAVINTIYFNEQYYGINGQATNPLYTMSPIGSGFSVPSSSNMQINFGINNVTNFKMTIFAYDNYFFVRGTNAGNSIKYVNTLVYPWEDIEVDLTDVVPDYANYTGVSNSVAFNNRVFLVVGNSVVYCDVISQTQEALTTVTGSVISLPYCRIATGSYVGNGQEGASYPTSITFPFTPKIVLISNDYGNYSFIQWNAPRFIYLYRTEISSLYMSICAATYTTNKISWYREDSGGYGSGTLQLNSSGEKYNYTAFG